MNNREIRDALASVFLEEQLTVRVKHARSTDSVYMTISNDTTSYIIRIANHRATVKYNQIHDYWIDTSKPNLVASMNAALKGAELRFRTMFMEVIPEPKKVVEEVPVSEEVVKISDYSNQLCPDTSRSMINLGQYYLSAQGFVCEIDHESHAPVEKWNDYLPSQLDDSDPWGGVKFFVLLIAILTAVYVCI